MCLRERGKPPPDTYLGNVINVKNVRTFTSHNKIKQMYSLDCDYYTEEFNTIDQLIDDVISSGMDPNYEITKNGKLTGETVFDLMPM